ncbi:MAG: toll/interleukin-1 receptor domain-containing protein [Clostridia bacterium]|nr:toll/interleukin-1 receptor domain-containing protein [Clostridia bacterium]
MQCHFAIYSVLSLFISVSIFISHAGQDLHIARALATNLIDDGFSVFLDDWSIDFGENIISRISEAIEESHSLIMLISEDYLRSIFSSYE